MKIFKISYLIFILLILFSCELPNQGNVPYEGREINYKIIEQGNKSGIKTKRELVIRDKDTLGMVYELHDNKISIPDINFDTNSVIGLFLGENTKGIYKVEIKQIVEYDTKVTVYSKIYINEYNNVNSPFCIVELSEILPNKNIEFVIEENNENNENKINKEIFFTTLDKGNSSCLTEAKEVIKEKVKFENFYLKHLECNLSESKSINPDKFNIDFNNEMVICLILPSYTKDSSLEIYKIVETIEQIKVYAYLKNFNLPKENILLKIYHLYHFIKIPKSDKKVEFILSYN